jgi:hypothetical protein
MFSRVSALLLAAVSTCVACDCNEPSVDFKRNHADIIFRGTIVELRSSSKPSGISGIRDLNKIAVFRVSRVWNGTVDRRFEMPAVEEAAACVGFWPDFLKVGEDLLVYARLQGSEYVTGICGQHKPAKLAEKDFKALGPGREPEASTHIPK